VLRKSFRKVPRKSLWSKTLPILARLLKKYPKRIFEDRKLHFHQLYLDLASPSLIFHLRLYTRNWSALTGLKNTRTFSAGVKYALKTSKIRMRCTVRFNKNTSMLDVLDMYLCVTNVISQNFQSIDTSMRNYQPRITMNTIFKNTIL